MVVGAGIAGLTTALWLARAGRDVAVLERAEPFREGSGVNAGTLALQNKITPMLAFFREANGEWDRFSDALGGTIGKARRGGLRIASTEADVAALRRAREEQTALGVETEWLEGNSLRTRFPWIGADVRCATRCAGDGFASPLLAGRALLREVRAAGARIVAPAAVAAVDRRGDGYQVQTALGSTICRNVVIAAGPWSEIVGKLFGISVPVETHVNMLSVTEPLAPFMDQVVTHISGRLTMKQYANGTCIVGGGWQGTGGVETGEKRLDWQQLVQNLELATTVVPPLRAASIVRQWAGFEGQTPDGWPIIGPVSGHDGLFCAVTGRAGFTGGLLTGRAAAAAVLGNPLPEVAADCGLERFEN